MIREHFLEAQKRGEEQGLSFPSLEEVKERSMMEVMGKAVDGVEEFYCLW